MATAKVVVVVLLVKMMIVDQCHGHDPVPLGLESNVIPDSSLTASSEYNADHGAKRGRLNLARVGNLRGAWSALTNNANQWIQVDLLDLYRVISVATQGREDVSQWVTSYKLACSTDGTTFHTVQGISTNPGADRIFTGNVDRNTIVTNTLPVPQICRYVRLMPVSWFGHISLRMEIYGEGPLTANLNDPDPLGLESYVIPDSSLTASSEYNADHGAKRGRLNLARVGNLRGAWSALTNNANQWIQVDLLDLYRVISVATQGREDVSQWVTSYKFACSTDATTFHTVQGISTNPGADRIFTGNVDRNTIVTNTLPVPQICRYVRLMPVSWFGHISLRMEIYGEGPLTANLNDPDPLGLESYVIPDSSLTASSEYNADHGAKRGRLNLARVGNLRGAWSALTNNANQWIQVDLLDLYRVISVATQGREDVSQWVTSYKFACSTDATTFHTVQGISTNPGADRIFTGNVDRNTIVTNTLPVPQICRYVRLMPVSWFGHISLRMEIYGEGPLTANLNDPDPLGLESYVIPDSSLTASSEYNADHGAKRGRLNLARVGNLRGAWSALTNNANQWIQVDLLDLYRVISVATQGREDVSQWVTSYKFACSTDATTFHTVQGISTNPGADRIFTGNVDRNTIVTNTLPVPQICRYVRLMPVSWFGHISLRMEIYGEGPLTANLNDPDPLGLESYVIPDSSLTASSEYNADHGAKRGRLNLARVGNLRGAWSALTNNANQWIQVDLLDLYRVISVATQGREDVSQWVTSYKFACSTDGTTFHTVQGISTNPGADRIFTGNVDRNTIVTNTLPVPQICRYVRLMPVSWFGHISLRMEIYGEGPLTANLTDPVPLGLESYVIPDSSLTASSEYNADHGAKRGRLNLARVGNLRGAWSALTNNANQWIQVDLLDLYRVISVATQGREDVSQWVTSYKFACSTDATTFHTVQGISTNPGADRIFTGNVDRNTIVTNTLPVPQICRYVRLMPVSWFGHISLRMEIYGEGPLTANLNDPDPLGLESYVIPDSSLTASSEYNADHGAKRGRLNLARVGNLRGAWSALTNNANQWIQVDLLDLYRVISVATQGREDVSQWVTSYKFACSTDGTTFHTVQGISTNPGADRIFTGNVDRNTIVTNTLPVPQICRYVRLMPVSWFGHISLRMEIYGEGPLTANLNDPDPLGLESYVIPDSSLTASSEYNADHGAKRGRLNLARVGNLRGAWSALTNNANQWIQVDLLDLYRVISVATQGREDVSQWVTSYKLACSTDGTTFHTVQGISTNPGADRIFTGNVDRNTIVTNTLPVPQICRYVRLMPVSWFGHISLRMEIYGEGPLTANLNDPDPLGLESYVIPDSSLTASSEYNADHGAKRGRLNLARVGNLRGAWSALTNNANQWIQVDLLDLYRVISVATQGREDVSQWVTSYKLACSTDGTTFDTVQGISTNPGADRIFTGNVDRNTIVTNTLPVPQICRYVRLMPVSWFGHISLRMEIYGEGPLTANLNDPDPLGLESYVIPDSSLTASSEYNADHGAKRGRLNLARVGNLRGAWSALTNNANQWIQVDLLDLYRVISVATQGREDVSQWVTSYKLACSTDGTTFHTVQGISTNPGADRIFTGNVDRNTIVTNTLPVPQICRYVRLMPVSWFGHISLRMEIYGEGPLTANLNDPVPLGLESYVIPDSSLTASSEYNADHGAKRGRLNLARVGNLRGAWSALTNNANQWIQVDLLDLYRVISVATQGREDVSQWVTSYKLACSTDGTTFDTVQGISTNPGADRIFTGNVDRNTIVTNTLPVPQICRYVRLMPVSWFGHISLRMEIYGEGPLTANLTDPVPLGLESYVIPDSSLTASSEYNADHGAKRGRLNLARVGNLRGAWSALTNNANQWIQVDLLDLYRVISVATQGREDVSQWVTSYKLACSTDGTTFDTVQGISTNPGADRIFTGNVDRNTIVTNTLPVPQICRYVRLMPVSWFGHISLRMEIYGEGPLTANLTDPVPLGLESYVIPDSSLTASSEYNADHGAKRGRLNLARVGNLRGAWSALTNNANQWIQVDLLDLYRVISVATQGREDVSQWVTSYKLACSTDGTTFDTVQGISTNPGADRIFTGNVDRNTIVTNTLPVPQICRYVRLMPVSWFGHISLRMEIYGEGPLTANLTDPVPLGLESYVIPDSSLTASSEYNADHGAKRGRLNLARVGNLRGAWSALTNNANQWIQVDLLDLYRVISVATQGREDVSQWVTSYKLACSTDGTTFDTVQGISTNPGADRIFTGNVDRNTIVTNTLPVPQICRYVRLMPVSWFGHISLRMEIYGEGPLTANLTDPVPLGLESYVIPDSSLTASSEYNADHGAKRGRLNLARVGNLRGAWSALTNNANQWIQVDLLDLYRVISVATQGREDVSQWVTSYKLACSTDGTTFDTVQGISTNPGADRIFTGNVDRNTIVTNTLPVPQICRYVRLMPVSWFGHISLRMEIYGEGPLTANLTDPVPLGLESYVIPDSSLTASSEYNADHGAKRGRLNLARVGNLRGAWSALTNNANQWIQVDLLDLYRVISVATQGREDVSQWVTSYKLACSTDGTTFDTVQGISTNPGADRIFTGNVDRNTIVTNTLPVPQICRYVRLMPVSWFGHISLRMEIYGEGPLTANLTDPVPLGLESYVIPDSSLTASSEYNADHGAKRGRLNLARVGNLRGAWSALTNNANQWIQVDLLDLYRVISVATQGREDVSQWVTSYKLACSTDGTTFDTVQGISTNPGADRIFTGNVDRNTIVTNTLPVPQICRYVRLMPVSWFGHISLRMEIYGEGPLTANLTDPVPLGLESYVIPDSSLTASSEYNADHGAKRGRLNLARVGNLRGAWSALTNNANQWIQVDLLDLYRVISVATQGREDVSQWVTSYKLACSTDGTTFDTVQGISTNPGADRIFTGNVDRNTIVTNTLPVPQICRYVRLMPVSWFGHISLRMEIYGEGPLTANLTDPVPLGLESYVIPDSSLTASSEYNADHGAKRGRLNLARVGNLRGAWSALTNNANQWIQVDLLDLYRVISVATQGREDVSQWVTSYKLACSTDGTTFDTVQGISTNPGADRIFTGNVDRNTIVTNTLPVPQICRYVRLMPVSWFGHISLRMEIYGEGPLTANLTDPVPLGLESYVIPDSSLTASSEYNADHGAKRGRLNLARVGNLRGAWSALTNNANQWIQVDLLDLHRVISVATQGREDVSQWVTSYKLACSTDGTTFDTVQGISTNPGADRIFTGNVDRNTIVTNTLPVPQICRYVRLMPVSWFGHISLRMEIYGEGPLTANLTDPVPLGLESYVIPDSSLTASSEYNADHGAKRGRLNLARVGNLRGAWSALTNNANQWIQVDLLDLHRVISVATQGREDVSQWVTSYKLACSTDGTTFDTVQGISTNPGADRIFTGNVDRNTIVTNTLPVPQICRYVRLMPVSWFGHISLRMEIYGEGPLTANLTDPVPLGLESYVIPDSSLTASSEYNADHGAKRGRLNLARVGNLRGAWSALTNNANQWIQVDLLDLYRVISVATQGREDVSQWVTSYKLACSTDGTTFDAVQGISTNPGADRIFTGNVDRNTIVTNTLPVPQICRYVRLMPVSWFGHISLRMEIYGEGPLTSNLNDPVPLGLDSYVIPDSSLTASSEYNADHGAKRGRLNLARVGNLRGAWSALTNNANQWIQVDLLDLYRVISVATQGREDVSQWVTSYKLACSTDGTTFHTVQGISTNPGADRIFTGNVDRNTIVTNTLPVPQICRYVRLMPVSWFGHISLRMEIYGEGPLTVGMDNIADLIRNFNLQNHT